MKVILIVHNQLELLQLELESLKSFANVLDNDIIIVDNASEDGTRYWIEQQEKWDYIVCDEGVENYSVIMNAVINEFRINDNILILMPNYMVLPGTIQNLQKILHEDKMIGAVTAGLIYKKDNENIDYDILLNSGRKQNTALNEKKQTMEILPGAVLISRQLLERLNGFNEKIRLPESVIMDLAFRGMCEGYLFYRCENAFFYKLDKDKTGYEDDQKRMIDRKILKQIWHMNYFNVTPNEKIVSCIQETKEAQLKILEIGCDCGANLMEIKNRFPGADLYGVELNEKSAEVAKNIACVQVANIEEKNIQFKNILFDYIIFGDVLEHLHDPAQTLRYCRELLDGNGKIIASIPNIMHYSVIRELLNGNFTYTDTGLLDRTHIHFFTYKEIMKMFEQEGYHVQNIDKTLESFEISKSDQEFVEKLMDISKGVDKEMFYAFQYVVLAEKDEIE